MFRKADFMEDRKQKIVRMFKMEEDELTVRDLANNNLVPVPGKATAEGTKKYMLRLAYI